MIPLNDQPKEKYCAVGSTGEIRSSAPEQNLPKAGFAVSIHDLSVTNFRETIGGIEVVDAQFADRILRAMSKMLVRHMRWRHATAAFHALTDKSSPDWRMAKSAADKARRAYRGSRKEAYRILHDACDFGVSPNTEM